MKKVLLLVCATMCVSLMLSARDIKTNDGKSYKGVSISSVTPIGIDISYQKDGTYFIKLLPFINLSKEIQKEFHYNPEKAEAYVNNLKKRSKMIREKYAEELKKDKTKNAKHYEMLSRIDAGAINTILKVYSTKPDGVVAWADSLEDTSSTSGHLGKIFVYGILGLSGGEEARVVYPTGTTRYGFPCYAASPEQALLLKQIANK